eukprot:scaffold38142_cov65-Phaeocystis_antarctica.AAC.2
MNLYACVAGRGGERAKAMHSASVSSRSPPPPGGLEGGQRGRCRADRGVCCALSQWGSARHSCPFGERRAAPCQCSLSRRRPWGGCRGLARRPRRAQQAGLPPPPSQRPPAETARVAAAAAALRPSTGGRQRAQRCGWLSARAAAAAAAAAVA